MTYKFVRGILMIGVFALFITIAHGLNVQAQDVAPASETVDMPAAGDLVTANDSLGGVFGVSETGRYIIQLEDPAVPSYTGGIAGLEATSPQVTGESRLDANTPAVQAYISYLHGKQDELLADMNATLGRSVELVFRYESAMNGLAVVMSHEEAVEVSQLPGVKAVFGEIEEELATDVGPWFLGAPSIWFGDTGSGVATRGEGVIVGIIDTGVNFDHPSFAATDGDGYTHTNPYGAGVYNGWCDANPGFCNDKLIGAYGLNPVGGNPADDHGHGSHTGSTAAGNLHDAVFDVGTETFTLTVAGVAPRANVVHYKVCTPSCPQAASVAAVNHAINDDMVDVLNFSISGSDNPWNDIVDIAFLEGFNAGIYIAASAGNSGPGASTVAKTGPWNASTGASTINRIIAHTVDVVSPGTPPELQDMAAVPGENVAIVTDITEEIRYNAANPEGCNPGHPPGFFDDSIALVIRGACTFAEKVNNAAAAGAEAVIVFNHVGGPPISMGATPATPPSVMIDNVNGADLRDYIIANPGAEVTINAQTAISYNDDWENVVAGFSSRGPSQFEMLAPTFIAPGVNTLAAGAFGAGDYYFSQGTSMSSPHAAGAGALLAALNPTWSPAEIRSALAMTANPDGMVKEDGATPVDWFDVGSGLLDLTAAGNIGLVMDETYDNFVDANPDIGGDPKTLNLPAFLNYNCTGECSWTRTVTSVAQDPVTYAAVVEVPAGMTITVEPASFTIDPGATQVLTVTVDVDGMAIGDFAFADVKLEAVGQLVLEEDFEGTFPPTDWDVIDNGGDCVWERNDEVPNGRPNYAGGEGFSAAADSDRCGSGTTMDTELHSLLIDLSDPDAASATLDFVASYRHLGSSSFQVHVSDDNGTSWDTLLTWTADVDPTGPGAPVSLDLTPYLGSSEVVVSFHYTAPGWDWWAQVDQIRVTTQEANPAADVHMPVAVIPALAVPVITVDPDELSAEQAPDTQTTQTLTIGNDGGVDLDWNFGLGTPSVLLYDNGPFITSFGDGPGGSDVSLLQNVSLGMTTLGAAVNLSAGGPHFRIADEFEVTDPNGLMIDEAVFFAYQTGSSTTSSFTGVNYQIWDGPPDDPGSSVVFGDDTTNRIEDTDWTNVYRYAENNIGNTQRPIMYIAGEAGVLLMPGTYWIDWQLDGSIASGPWQPPITIMGETTTGNAMQLAATGWQPFLDGGSGTAQGAPFQLWGTATCDDPDAISWLDVSPDSGTITAGETDEVEVTLDSTGLAPDTYTANLCVLSNDPATPIVLVPVTLTVGETPAIEVDPESLASSQPENSQTTHTLEISNVGEGSLDWDIEEAEMEAGITRSNNPLRIVPDELPAAADLMRDYNNMPLADVIEDGGFEAGTPNPFWDEGSTNFGTPLCTVADCGDGGGTGPNNGSWWAWFGGINAAETGFVRQMVTLDAGAAELSFWLEIPSASGTGNDFLEVSLDGTVIFSVTDADAGDYATYTEVVVDVSAFAGGTHELSFDSSVFGGGSVATNFFVDDVALDSQPSMSGCSAPTDISWLSVAPTSGSTPAGESDEVTVTIDSTGFAVGTYEALLCVNSNDPDNPVVEVPVTMTVVEAEAEYGVELTPATDSASGMPGDVVSYMLTITNTGDVADTFSLMASGNDWDVDLPADVMLDAGESTTFTAAVTIPMNAEDGEMDTVTVTATSMGDPDQSASSALTTTVDVDPDPEGTVLYLPIVIRN